MSSHVSAQLCTLEADRATKVAAVAGAQMKQQSGTLTGTSWTPSRELDMRAWLEHGRRFGMVGRGVAWWIGDWLIYGNARYGERYARAARATGYDTQSLMNMVYVASRFPATRRRASLSWSHHAELAALPPNEQDRWLELAEHERMSVRSLRGELQSARRAAGTIGQAARQLGSSPQGVCPTCRRAIEGSPDGAHVIAAEQSPAASYR